jgi:hypothetical protein
MYFTESEEIPGLSLVPVLFRGMISVTIPHFRQSLSRYENRSCPEFEIITFHVVLMVKIYRLWRF